MDLNFKLHFKNTQIGVFLFTLNFSFKTHIGEILGMSSSKTNMAKQAADAANNKEVQILSMQMHHTVGKHF